MYNDIVFTLQLDDFSANSRCNEMISKGWKLLHVGQQIGEDGHTYTCYVVGATQKLYDAYLKEEEAIEEFYNRISHLTD